MEPPPVNAPVSRVTEAVEEETVEEVVTEAVVDDVEEVEGEAVEGADEAFCNCPLVELNANIAAMMIMATTAIGIMSLVFMGL